MKKNISFTFLIYFLFASVLFAQEDFHLIATMSGDSIGDQFSIVSHIGDVNADGYDDVIVGAPGGDYAKLFFGGEVFDTIPDLTFKDYKEFNCRFGCSIAGGGDVNGDGYPDIIIGASSTWIGPSCPFECFVTGAAYVYFGGPEIDTTADLTLIVGSWEESTGWHYGFGLPVAIPGDINGDGYDDIAVGAANDDYDAHGRVYIYYGGPNIDDEYDVLLEGEEPFDNFGLSISDVGDINKDGFDDLLVGAPMLHNNIPGKIYQGGKAYLVYGGNEMSLANSEEFLGDSSLINYGRVVTGLGDVNCDGYDDVGIMALSYIKIIFGSNFNTEIRINADSLWWSFQYISGIGDINNDGFFDFAIGVENRGDQYSGLLGIYFGNEVIDTVPNLEISGTTPYEYFAYSIGELGNINSGNYGEIIVGEPGLFSPDSLGKVFIYSFDYPNEVREKKDLKIPKQLRLYQNYPNPFNNYTIIEFEMTKNELVVLEVFNLLGQKISTLINRILQQGKQRIHFNDESLPSGIYFYKIKTKDFTLQKKMVLMR